MVKKIASIPTKYLQDLVARVSFLEARLQAIEQAARNLVNELPESEIDLARKVWGNTNANCVLNRKNELVALLDGDK